MPKRDGLGDAVRTVRALRAEDGCPWDRAQTHASLRPYLLEETYEVLEALDALAASPTQDAVKNFKEELGDLLLQVLLHSEIARQDGNFTIDDVAGELSDKLVRRHPHVFGANKLKTPEEVVGAWEKRKKEEKPARDSVLEGIPAALPALQRSLKVIEKVSKVGFQWPDLKGPLEKMREELGEFEQEVRSAGAGLNRETSAKLPVETRRKLESEMGDLHGRERRLLPSPESRRRPPLHAHAFREAIPRGRSRREIAGTQTRGNVPRRDGHALGRGEEEREAITFSPSSCAELNRWCHQASTCGSWGHFWKSGNPPASSAGTKFPPANTCPRASARRCPRPATAHRKAAPPGSRNRRKAFLVPYCRQGGARDGNAPA
jgi:MazG family protein